MSSTHPTTLKGLQGDLFSGQWLSKPPRRGNGKHIRLKPLGDERRLEPTHHSEPMRILLTFTGYEFVDVCKVVEDKDGTLQPTGKVAVVKPDSLAGLIDLLAVPRRAP